MGYKVRFNLGRGENYKKWKVISDEGEIQSFDPMKGSLVMTDCRLCNKKGGAKKIFNGKNKFVVAWIYCKDFEYIEDLALGQEYDPCLQPEVSYNPRYCPYWEMYGQDLDGHEFNKLYTLENKVYIKT